MRKYFFTIAAVGLLLYLPSLSGPFLWDDEDFVYANKYVADFRLDKFFTESQTAGRGKLSNYFRPVPQIVYATTHAVFGFNPFWFHLINVLAHVSVACAIFYFFYLLIINKGWQRVEFLKVLGDSDRTQFSARDSDQALLRWRADRTLPLIISLFFLIHPTQTEAVSYISGLSDPLFVLFGFLSLIYFLKSRLLTSLLFFLLSLLSKETGLVFLPIILLLSFLTSSFNLRKSTIYLLSSIVYVWYHVTFINMLDIKSAWGNTPYASSITIRLLTFIQNFPTYLGLLVFPKDLFMERDYTTPIATSPFTLPIILFTFLIPLVFFLVRKNKFLLFCLLAFLLSFLPYSGLVLINGIFYEHFLYLPLVFFFGFWVFLLKLSPLGTKKILLVCAFIIFVALMARNVLRQLDWIDPIRFYSQTLSHAPQSIRIRNGLAMAYADKGDYANSIREYQLAISVNPNIPNLYHNLANSYLAIGDIKLAEENYLKAIQIDPNFIFSWQSLANLYQQTGQTTKLNELLKEYQSNIIPTSAGMAQ